MSDRQPVLETKNLTKCFPADGGKTLTACDNISIQFFRGETVAIVGESGCGKSTFARTILKLHDPTSGEIYLNGKDITKLKGEASRLERQNIQMVFQDPARAFNPKMRIRDIICEPLLNFGRISAKEKDAVAKEYLKMVELPESFSDRYPHSMSGGQRQRVGIARALTLNPDVIVLDEATSALDVSVQKSILTLVVKLQKEKGIAIVFICHDFSLVAQFAHRAAVMYLGNIVELLPGENLVVGGAAHPYTKSLIESIFDLNMDFSQEIKTIPGEIPSPIDLPPGCPFADRCSVCQDICRKEKPKLKTVAPGHQCACHLVKEVSSMQNVS